MSQNYFHNTGEYIFQMKLNENSQLTSLTSKTSLVNNLHGYEVLTKIKQPRQTEKFTLVKASLFS